MSIDIPSSSDWSLKAPINYLQWCANIQWNLKKSTNLQNGFASHIDGKRGINRVHKLVCIRSQINLGIFLYSIIVSSY
jgi:hypothetical protein